MFGLSSSLLLHDNEFTSNCASTRGGAIVSVTCTRYPLCGTSRATVKRLVIGMVNANIM